LGLLTEDAIGLLDAIGIDKVHWVGLSMGGMIGQSVALHHPNRLKSLALCDSTGVIPAEAQPLWQERLDAVRAKGVEPQLEPTLERWFTPFFLKSNPPILGVIRKQFLATPAEGYAGCIEAIRKLNTLDRLSNIKLPTLIMVGEDDPGTPVSASEAMHKKISNSKLVILPSARHLSNVEQPEAFNTHLLTFLKRL
jgi:3-oxoadipate enol-lactonase